MRQEVKRSISECAELIGISRQRYRHIELGETDISVVQLEALCQFLNLPLGRVLPQVQVTLPISPILLQTEQGQMVRLIVQLVT